MGQYWKPVMEDANGERVYVNTHLWDNGYKFMEHSWIGNEVPGVVMYMVYQTPMKVSWVGDYCDDPVCKDGPTGTDLYNDQEALSLVNEKHIPGYMRDERLNEDKLYSISDEFVNMFDPEHIVNYNLVNHTKKEYLSMKEYMAELEGISWKMHPLPVLTAGPSMGFGGGDYYEDCATNWGRVGIWSWDIISVEDVSDFIKVEKSPIDVVVNPMKKLLGIETNGKYSHYKKVDIKDYVFKELRD